VLTHHAKLIWLCAGLSLLALTVALPAPEGLTVPAWRMAGIAALMATWWIGEAIPLAGTALVPLVAFPLLGILPSGTAAREYGNHLIYLFLGGFLIAIAMERWNLHRRIAMRLLVLFGTEPRRLVAGFGVTVALLSMWISNTAATLMTLPVAMAVVRHLAASARIDGNQDEARALAAMGPVFMLTVAYAANAGGMATLVGTPANIVMAGAVFELVDGAEIGFARWMLLGIPASLSLLALTLWVVPRSGPSLDLFDCGQGASQMIRDELELLGPMTTGEKRVLAVFVATVVLWLTRAPVAMGDFTIPGWSTLLPDPKAVHDSTVAIAAGITLMALRAPRGGESAPVLDWGSVKKGVPWGVLILFGGGFALARGFVETGLSGWLGERLSVLGGAPLPLIILGVCLLTTFLTEVTSNTATSTVLMPVLAATAVAMGVAPTMLMIPAALSASCAFMLPVATPPNAVVFGSGWITIRHMARVGLVMNLGGAVILTLLSWALARYVV
jgi:sodium-dependent dicarboxylate transporter 2/3/5